MKIRSFSRSGNLTTPNEIKISKQEALVLIKSLTEQLKNNPTVGCAEIRDNEGGYFSISVCEADFIGTRNGYR
jgi:hypothetical protein